MALTMCPDCKSEVSTAATACPKCGAPAARNPAVAKNIAAAAERVSTWRESMWAGIVALGFWVLYNAFSPSEITDDSLSLVVWFARGFLAFVILSWIMKRQAEAALEAASRSK